MLQVERHRGAEQQDQPAEIQPEHEQDQDREAGVDRGVAGRGGGEQGEGPAGRLPQDAAHHAADQRRPEPHPGVGHEGVDEGEGADHQHVRQQVPDLQREPADRLHPHRLAHHARARRGGGDAHGREHQQRADQQRREVAAEALADAARAAHVPDVVERLLDLLHQRDRGVEQQREADRAEHADVDVLDELDDALGDLDALLAQRLEEREQHGADLVVDAEGLQHREAEREQRHERQQRGVDQPHRAQRELALRQVAHQHEQHAGDAHQPGLRARPALGRPPPDGLVDPLEQRRRDALHARHCSRLGRCSALLRDPRRRGGRP